MERYAKQPVRNRFVIRLVACAVLAGAASPATAAPQKPLPIIPGAAGFGMETPAGSGRHLERPETRIIKVTNLNDSGPGSLREAIGAKEPRVVVFEVSGYIDLKSGINVSSPYLTVAGQTAPWPGIILRGGFGIGVGTHDVLIQHIGLRAGDQVEGGYMPHRGCISASGKNIIFDHLSTGWAHQASMGVFSGDVTVRLCIVSEGWYDAGHNEPKHSKGLGIGLGHQKERGKREGIAILGNLFAHNEDRNPDVAQNSSVAILNNIVYNYAGTGVKIMRDPVTVTIAGNVFASGVDTGGDPDRPWRGKAAWIYLSHPESRVLFSPDNLIGGKTYDNPWEQINARRIMSEPSSKPEPLAIVKEPLLVVPGYHVKPAREAEQWVLANVGPFPAHRGPIDARIVYETRTRTGRGRDDLDDVGGWPNLEENRRALVLPDNPNFVNSDGYTNLEKWLHAFADEVEGRKGPVAGADPDLGKREAQRCAKKPAVLAPDVVKKIRETKSQWTFDAAEAKRRQEAAARAARLPVTRRVDLGDGAAIELKLIPPGEFMMGSKYPPAVTKARGPGGINLYGREYPARRVRITRPYYIGIYEVTWAVWDKVVGTQSKQDPRLPAMALCAYKGSMIKSDRPGGDTFFLRELNETIGKKERLAFRLPTEAEWEYACRAGTDTPFWFGEQISLEKANYNGEPWYPEPHETPYEPRGKLAKQPPPRKVMPVGSFAPNPWGLYDTVGNASELVQGFYGPYPEGEEPLVDPQAPTRFWSGIRITRGGDCNSFPSECRSAYGSYLAVYGDSERSGLRLTAVPVSGD